MPEEIVLFYNDFSPGGEQPEQRVLAHIMATNLRLYCCLSQNMRVL